ncbi:MAG: hypothetical protein ILP02_02850 [Clostridia bacterium]|nr:hypothetical protein [Clostridia bacterium]
MTVKAELRVAGAAIATEEVPYVADCYSAAYDLTLTRERVTGHTFCSTRVYDEKVADKVDAAIPPYSRFLKFVGETIRIADVGVGEGFLTFDALIEGDALMTDEDGAMFSQKFRLPIKLRLPSAAGHIGGVKAVVSALTGKMKNGALEAEAYITVKVDEYEAYEHDFIVEASEGENKKDDLPAISVYIGSRGDEAWDVMKSLGASEQDILSFNPDITFPLVGGERILIYRKL